MTPGGALPVVSLSEPEERTAATIRDACREHGFFYVVDHGVDESLGARLETLSREFFALPRAEKDRIRMELGGRAWRGYFPVGDELTSGVPDQKEGLYFGEELGASSPRVRAGTPLHGPNLFPERPRDLRPAVLDYMAAMRLLAARVLRGIARSLSLDADYFEARYTRDPLILFRIFHYPGIPEGAPGWSVGEHTDYGLLTVLRQDDRGGLQVKTPAGFVDAPPIEGSFVCNIGDMLDRMTGGLYRSTPHRVRNTGSRGRLSFPFFFDPGWDAKVRPIPTGVEVEDDGARRWDGASVHAFDGTYGDYLLAKVSKVFPGLKDDVL